MSKGLHALAPEASKHELVLPMFILLSHLFVLYVPFVFLLIIIILLLLLLILLPFFASLFLGVVPHWLVLVGNNM